MPYTEGRRTEPDRQTLCLNLSAAYNVLEPMLHRQLQAEAVAPRKPQRCERVLGVIDWADGVYDVFPEDPKKA
jgi:hypothetical protein